MDFDEELAQRIEDTACEVVECASRLGLTVSTAESLTAGMVAAAIADIPGASLVLRGGAVTYVNEVKEAVLGVSAADIDRYTEVSHPVARQMAAGSRRLFATDVAVSLTGYAGPGGGTADDPVGTVYLGISYEGHIDSVRAVFSGDRAAVRRQATLRALELLLSSLSSSGTGLFGATSAASDVAS